MEQKVWSCDYCQAKTVAVMAQREWVGLEGMLTLFDGNEESCTAPIHRVEPQHHFCSVGHMILWLKAIVNERRKEQAHGKS